MLFDPLELNYSKIKSYLDCPRLYKYIYVEQKRAPLTAGASLGISIHRALEVYHRTGGGLESLLESYDANWVNGGFSSSQEQVEFYNRGRDMLERYWNSDRDRKSRVVHVEKDFEFAMEKWRVRGTMDRVDLHPDGTWEIIDYKTGTEIKSEAEMTDSLQMGIYGLGMKRGLGISPDRITFWFLAQTKKATVFYDSSREESVLSVFKDAGEAILAEDYSPNTSNCRFCGFRKICGFSPEKEDIFRSADS